MIKSVIRRASKLGLVGGIVLASWLGQPGKLLALPEAEVIQTLATVPVFTIADSQGAPLVASGEGDAKIAGVFLSQKDAQNFINKLKTENPDLGSKVQVVPVSLGEVYQLAEENKKQADGLNFTYVPVQAQVEAAKKFGEQYQGGVPLFVARGGQDQGYLTVQKGEEEFIPFFFEQQQIEQMVARFKQEQPSLASTVKIEVVPLEGIIATLQKSDDALLKKIMLVPSQESIQFLQSLSQSQDK
jgi:hypothetical protein